MRRRPHRAASHQGEGTARPARGRLAHRPARPGEPGAAAVVQAPARPAAPHRPPRRPGRLESLPGFAVRGDRRRPRPGRAVAASASCHSAAASRPRPCSSPGIARPAGAGPPSAMPRSSVSTPWTYRNAPESAEEGTEHENHREIFLGHPFPQAPCGVSWR